MWTRIQTPRLIRTMNIRRRLRRAHAERRFVLRNVGSVGRRCGGGDVGGNRGAMRGRCTISVCGREGIVGGFGGRFCGGGFDGRRGEVLPLVPAVEVDERLHAAPFHDFAFQPGEADGLEEVSKFVQGI